MDVKNNILELIGNTPLVRINHLRPNKETDIWAKLESFNPGGSIKDRPALYMIEEAEKKGELTKDKIILEATSGNTGIGLALVAAVKGYRILLIMSEGVSEERKKILKALGAEIKLTPAHLGTDGAIEYAYNLAREEPDKYWLVDQFNNEANWKAHYHTTAMEIWEQTKGKVDAVVIAMGTTGTLMGVSRRLKELKPEVRIIGVEPYMGHKIQGLKNMKESYAPGIFDKRFVDKIINIDDEEAFEITRMLAKKEGLFVGMSSGAAMAGALKISKEIGRGNIVVIFPDGGDRYLSTSLFTIRESTGIYFYNTLGHKKEEFIPIKEDSVKIYTCGPTLCEYISLNQCRRFVFADIVRRYLEFKGYKVVHVINLTDLDENTIRGAEEKGLSLKDFTSIYLKAFLEDLNELGIKRPEHLPKASEHVEDMIKLTEKLVEKGFAYEKFKSIYFDISRLSDYGKLSRIDLDKIQVGKTVDLERYEKENPRDFTLLKRCTLKELKKGIYFKTKWGNVIPSWHMECAAIVLAYMKGKYDIHTSGIELIFPHHENILAIGKAITGEEVANYWLHNETVKGGESITLRDVLERGYTGRHVRYLLLSRHYRKPFIFTWQKLDACKNTVMHMDQFVQRLYFYKQLCRIVEKRYIQKEDVDQMIYDLKHSFTEDMDNDLNLPSAIANLFSFIRETNRLMDENRLPAEKIDDILKILTQINSILNIMELEPPLFEEDEEIVKIIREREEARKRKDWEKADQLRKYLREKGIEVIDTKYGPIWKRLK